MTPAVRCQVLLSLTHPKEAQDEEEGGQAEYGGPRPCLVTPTT